MSKAPVKIFTVSIGEHADVSEEKIARIDRLSMPLAETILNLAPDDRHNVMGSLICSYAMSFDDPADALDVLFTNIINAMPDVAEQFERSESPS